MDDIIRMARGQGLPETATEGVFIVNSDDLGRMLAAEREACAALVEANAMACHSPIYRSLLQSNADAIRARGQDPMPLFDDWGKDWEMNKIEFGDCRETMRRWAADGVKVQMCVTSPPYFGLRDYGHDGQIGLEETPEQYIAAMVEVFRCVKDVLADDGTLWLNIGDSYARNGGGVESKMNTVHKMGVGQKATYLAGGMQSINKVPEGLKSKDLIGIPWMLAFALRADGWYLRQDIIWHKPNPMPESVRDRCTKAHEYIFLLSKSDRYFFDSDAIKEPAKVSSEGIRFGGSKYGDSNDPKHATKSGNVSKEYEKANKRSVWSVATKPYKGAHFATFPTALVEPCILAGSRPGDIVLDPFMGSGTTAQVAMQHDRKYLGCELNPEYGALQQERISSEMTLFNQPICSHSDATVSP